MRTTILSFIILFTSFFTFGQTLTGSQLLEKAIQYHDPNNNWNTFSNTLFVTMESPNNSNRDSEIKINLPSEYFKVKATRDSNTTEYTINKGICSLALNGKTDLSETVLKQYNLNCDRATLYKNYYTYLYGLPMKLKDPGTHILESIERKTFKGKEYLVLNVTYNTAQSDVWSFYFNPETYAMEVYQFFKTDKNNNIIKDSGEYILLSEIAIINEIKMPKIRTWYYNKDDGYLGTDILKQ
ncbi:hypothetical protein D7030_05645 [Flavobacteriaceae bacterium AU392]|nr:hypothetical protein D1817_02775 [Flavobacteriaceae bacterium]RKM84618.1 hypothetical protein D7030_05645 [Flavobacteriaceae bacterium AU392]